MRILRHGVRDLWLAFGLAFDLRRVAQAGSALLWTMIVGVGVFAVLSWRVSGSVLSPDGVFAAWELLRVEPFAPLHVFISVCVLAGWWTGFSYLCAPVLRSAAVDISRDERDRNPNIPALNRQASFSPFLMAIVPGLCLLLLLLWSLLTFIPGVAGGVISTLSLPLVLVLVAFGAAFLVVGVVSAPLMGPSAVIEGRDYFEAVSRAMSYVMQRPGRYFAYWAAKLGVMAASLLFGAVVLVAMWAMVALALWMVGQGAVVRHAFAEACVSGTGDFSRAPVAFGIAVVFWCSLFLLTAWWMVVGLSADVLIYLLLRYRIDGVTFDKIVFAEEQESRYKNAIETAEEAESARKRHDERQTEEPDSAAAAAAD